MHLLIFSVLELRAKSCVKPLLANSLGTPSIDCLHWTTGQPLCRTSKQLIRYCTSVSLLHPIGRFSTQNSNLVWLLQVKSLIKVAGPNISQLHAAGAHIPHLGLMQLMNLHLEYDASDPGSHDAHFRANVDLSRLSAIHGLEALHLKFVNKPGEYETMLFLGLSKLPSLAAVHVLNGMIAGLPASVTELDVLFEQDTQARELHHPGQYQQSLFKGCLGGFQGHLSRVGLDMRFWSNFPQYLQDPDCGAPCLREVSDVWLVFAAEREVTSLWCQGFFTSLRLLHLDFCHVPYPFCSEWDLSDLKCLERLSVSIDTRYPQCLCLAHISGVTATMFNVTFRCQMARSSPRFNFLSWTLLRVNICFCQYSRMGLPTCVNETIGALQYMAVVPAITVHGGPPAAAAQAAQALAAQAFDWDASSSTDSECFE